MGIGNRGDRAVNHGQPGEFRRGQHRAFDMDMGIHQAGQNEAGAQRPAIAADPTDQAARILHGTGKFGPVNDIDDSPGDPLDAHPENLARPEPKGNLVG